MNVVIIAALGAQTLCVVLLTLLVLRRGTKELDLFDTVFRAAISKTTTEFRSIQPKPQPPTDDAKLVDSLLGKVREASGPTQRQPVGFDGT